MIFRQIAKDVRVESNSDGTAQDFELEPSPGGHVIKVCNYMVVVKQKSGTNARLGLKLNHGPNGIVSIAHSQPVAVTTLGAGVLLIGGDSDVTKVLSEYLHVILTCQSTGGNREWAVCDVYEMRKPF